ncbi:AAA family ATPase [Pseudoalteromonas piscicida]|uniref:Cell division protein DamX n=1 Tax=Pseudoalteromonas piscicida TaxID=43662 RepID=A0A2A5JW11_PSEO7|nr:AAA family ATPase [Pseudoalteromonas piscicida]PCK33481.1 cell division protein DamX [Pseudoalteromonas piscicida]
MQSQILPSRAALVDRIAMQFDYGQNLITLVGSSGLGKSYLAESFLTDKYPDFNKAFVKLSANTQELDVVRQLLEHSFRSPLIDQKLSLSENFMLLHDEQPCGPCLWVLDNVRHLTQELAEQLQKLAKSSRETIYILATAQQPQLLPESLDIHIEPLSLLESKRLMKMFYKDLPPDEDPIFNTFVTEARGNPSVLLSWQPEQQQLNLRDKQVNKRVKSQWQWYVIALCLVLTSLMVALVYKQEITRYWQSEDAQDAVATAMDAQSVFKALDKESEQSEGVMAQPSDVPVATANQDEVIERAPVDSILSALTEADEARATQDSPASLSEQVEEISQSNFERDDQVALTTDEPESKDINVLSGNAWYLSRSDEEWVIQLLAVTENEIAKDFIAQHSAVPMQQFTVLRNNRTWFVVTSDAYENLALAKQAKAQLPDTLQKGQPFFKRMSKIKQEITQSLGN